ncbi:MAG: methyltransferase family protein [Promethearchaeota archaeon]
MNQEKNTAHEREAPHSHFIQGLSPVIFTVILGLDSWLLHWSTQLNDVVPLFIRWILFAIFLCTAFSLMYFSHKALFSGHEPSDSLVSGGILKSVRNPMYLGIMCIYIAFFCLSISFIALGAFVVVFLVYNKMVQYEEGILEEMFGDAFLDYKKRVPRWIPKIINK